MHENPQLQETLDIEDRWTCAREAKLTMLHEVRMCTYRFVLSQAS